MGYPCREDLIDILKENFTEKEAAVALAIPNTVIPLRPVGVEEIEKSMDLPREELLGILNHLAEKGLIYSGKMENGAMGYALHQVGFGFPQTFFWKGDDTPHARKMAALTAKYFNRKVTREAFSSGSDPKPYRYIPVKRSLEVSRQAVLPWHMMEKVIGDAKRVAVAHCACRMAYRLAGKSCKHPTEVCLKFNDMANYVIERGFAREITKEEALRLVSKAEEAGLVHFVDNAEGEIQHNCNCCGCACWNVGNIRRRKIPRDTLMATYFIRRTSAGECSGCGACAEICPVDAVKVEAGSAVVDEEWCIGCGVCSIVCATGAISIVPRPDKPGRLPAASFRELHEMILKRKGS
jgi:Fe-S-cluster-containing hydrogenase component 2